MVYSNKLTHKKQMLLLIGLQTIVTNLQYQMSSPKPTQSVYKQGPSKFGLGPSTTRINRTKRFLHKPISHYIYILKKKKKGKKTKIQFFTINNSVPEEWYKKMLLISNKNVVVLLIKHTMMKNNWYILQQWHVARISR